MNDSRQLLDDYARDKSEAAFRELVSRYLNPVYSCALRLVEGDAHRAKDVTQVVFADLARKAGELSPEVMLGGWLHRHTCFVAANTMRGERRRLARERKAVEMNSLHEDDTNLVFARLAPLLDETINQLDEADRTAILLRFFEQKDFGSVGQVLGSSEEASRKRVSRALDKLRDLLAQRGIRTTAAALTVAVSANAVQAAPAGLAVTISAAALAGTAATTSTLIASTTKTIAMTTLQKTLVTTVLTATIGGGLYAAKQAHDARAEVQTLQAQQAPLVEQVQQLQSERDDATNRLADLIAENSRLKANPHELELLRLRGEVTRLKTASEELALLKAAASTKTNDPTQMAMRNWVAQAQELHQRIDQMPEPQIPEFKFLTPNDWLDVAKDASLETDQDVRNAANILGADAKNRFAMLVRDALDKYVQTNNGELPTAMSQLEEYFPFPVDEDVLKRYAIIQSGQIGNLSETDRNFRVISEKPFAPVGSGSPLVQIGAEGFIRTGQ